VSVSGRVAAVFALLGAAVATGVALMAVVSIAGRALLNTPIPGDVELTQFGIALAISLALPWCQHQRANIIVDFFTQRLRAQRIRWLDAAGALLLALMCALLAWRTSVGALAVHAAGETTMIMALPMWWAYASLAPGLALTALIALLQAAALIQGRPVTTPNAPTQ
jgi:TRAP-type C4-dicarboxylate transport system permease small subunit